jgi:hypothetical protein
MEWDFEKFYDKNDTFSKIFSEKILSNHKNETLLLGCHFVIFPPFGSIRGKRGDKNDRGLNGKRTLRGKKHMG